MGVLLMPAQYLQPLGLWRITGLIDAQIRGFAIPEQEKQRARALYNMSHSISTLLNELIGSEFDADEAESPKSIDDLPLIVITQGEPVTLPKALPPAYTLEYFQELRNVWNDLQRDLTNLSANSIQVIATESGHANIHDKQPELIIGAISDIVLAIRSNVRLDAI